MPKGKLVLQYDETQAREETAKALLGSVTISLRHLLIIIHQTSRAYNTPTPTPDQVIEYMQSSRNSLFLKPD